MNYYILFIWGNIYIRNLLLEFFNEIIRIRNYIYILLNKYIFFNVLIIIFFLENILCVNGVIKKNIFYY